MITLRDLPLKGAVKDAQLEVIPNGGLLIKDDTIHELGTYASLKLKASDLNAELYDMAPGSVCMPSYIDAHTHICFGGSRARDYAMRNSGSSYLEIAKAGGGIWDTVQQTRKASKEELLTGMTARLDNLKFQGVTTVEVKSGYGLSVDQELKMLETIEQCRMQSELDIISTCLAAHIKPKDYSGNHAEYLEYIAQDLFPILKERNLTRRIDAFVEEEAFSYELTRVYFDMAREMGFDLTVHADQFSTDGSRLAVETKARSADHLEASRDKEITMLAASEVVATALPGASIGLGCDFTPARRLLDAGACVAIASDWNPGSAPMGNLLIQACILATFEKLSNAEVLAGLTYRAAHALGLQDRGRLVKGLKADFNIYQVDNFNEVFYHQGMIKPAQVWKSGQQLV